MRFARAGGLAPGELLLGLGVGAQLARDLISLGPQIAGLARVLGDVVELLRLRAARTTPRFRSSSRKPWLPLTAGFQVGT